MKKLILILSLLLITTSLFSEGDSRYDAGLNLPFNQKSGEVNPQTGNVTVNSTDVALPGRAGLNFSFGRVWTLNSSNVFNMDLNPNTFNNRLSSNTPESHHRLGVGWSSSIPYLHMDRGDNKEVLHLFFSGSAFQVDLGNVSNNNMSNSNLLGYNLLDKRIYSGALGSEVSYRDFGASLPARSTDDITQNSKYVLILKDNSKYYFKADGSLLMNQDPSGLNRIWYFYNSNGLLTSVIDTVGREIKFNYDADGNLSEITWDVDRWEKDAEGNRSLVTSSRSVKYSYISATSYSGVDELKSEVEGYKEPFSLTSVTNTIGEVTKYSYNPGLAEFSFNDRTHQDNAYLMLTSIMQNHYLDNELKDRYSSAKFYEYEVPAKGMHNRFFYTGYMEYYKVSRIYMHNRHKEVKNDTYYTYFANGENSNFNQYSTLMQQGNISTTYYYSLKDAPNLYQVLDKIETETVDGFYELRNFVYDRNKTKTLEEVFRFGELIYSEKFLYDRKRNLVKQVDKQGLITLMDYDPVYSIPVKEQKIVSYDSEKSTYTKEWVLDDKGRVLESILFIKGEDGKQTPIKEQVMEYDSYGNVISVTNAKNNTQHTVYDNKNLFPIYTWGEVTIDSYEAGAIVDNWNSTPDKKDKIVVGSRSVFNSDGTVFIEFDPEGNGVEHFYDNLSREIETVSPMDSNNLAWYRAIPDNVGDITSNPSFAAYLNSRKSNPGSKIIIDDKNAYIETIADLDRSAGKKVYTAVQSDGLENPEEEYSFDENRETWGVSKKVYDNLGRMVALTDPDAGEEYSEITVNNTVVKRFDKTWLIKYDDLGRQIKVVYPTAGEHNSSIKYITYDDLENSVETIDPEDRRSVVTSDWAGNIIELTQYGYSDTPESEVRKYRYFYDSLSRKRKFVDPSGEETLYEYNERDEIVKQTYGETGFDIISYDIMGLLASKTDRKGNIIKSFYDEASRPVKVARFKPDGTIDETTLLSYNKRGLNWRIEGKELIEYSEFDSKGALTTHSRYLKNNILRTLSNSALAQINESYTFNYEYTDSGLLKSMKYPDGGVHNFDYRDGTGYLDSIGEGSDLASVINFADRFSYNRSGVVTSMSWRNDIEQRWEFDNRKRINSLSILRAGEIIEDLNFSLNSVGDVKTINSNEYMYNGFGEIVGAKTLIPNKVFKGDLVRESFGSLSPDDDFIIDVPLIPEADINGDGRVNGDDHHLALLHDKNGVFDEEEFSYDKSGNRLTLNQNGAKYTYEYGVRNQLKTIYKSGIKYIDFEYDLNGNRIKKVSYSGDGDIITDYKYDTLNRLIETNSTDGGMSKYSYDNAGNRFVKDNEGCKTLYLRQGAIAVAMDIELPTGTVDHTINRYVLSGDLLSGRVSTIKKGTEIIKEYSYYHLDHLNSTKVVTNEAAEVVVKYEYRAFGDQLKRINEAKEETEDLGKYSYGGKELDDNINLYYFNQRYYDATIGRFINVDPIQDGTNWYIYCSNNPLNFTDPTGLAKSDIIVADTLSFLIGGPAGYLLNKSAQFLNFEMRDKLNKEPSSEPVNNPNFKKLSPEDSIFHQPDTGEKVNKYVSTVDGGKTETCWIDGTGEKLNDPNKKATYNYGGPGDTPISKVTHGLLDVVPWIAFGADRNDTSTAGERLGQTVQGGLDRLKNAVDEVGSKVEKTLSDGMHDMMKTPKEYR